MALLLLSGSQARAQTQLSAAQSTLSFPRVAESGFGVSLQLSGKGATFERAQPLQLELVGADKSMSWLRGSYAKIERDGPRLIAIGTLRSAAGTVWTFRDLYRAQSGWVNPNSKDATMSLLNAVCKPYNGTVGLPFLLSMPDAKVPSPGALSGQMGFVGQQIPACALLLRCGLENGDAQAIQHAETLVDF